MASQSTATVANGTDTILGLAAMSANAYGLSNISNFSLTLNSEYNFFPNELATGPLVRRFFHYGNGGRINDSSNLTSAQPVSGLDFNMINHLPVRAVPLSQDLSSDERALVAGREIRTVKGVPYAIYHLSALTITSTEPQFVRKDPVTGISTPYVPDPAGLQPVPLTPDANGLITDPADVISVVVPATITIKGADVIEVINALYDGDMRLAMISEYGLVAASPQSVNATDATGNSFPYTEAVMAMQASHYTWGGFQVVTEEDDYVRNIQLVLANFAIKK